MESNRVKAFLEDHAVKNVIIRHSPAFTASEVAASTHIAERDFAKTIVVFIDGEPAMVVLPANRRIALHELRELLEPAAVRLATESELHAMFPDCEVGAMPPFGNLYNIPVYVAPALARETTIAFNAGTHTEIIQFPYAEFEQLVMPRPIDFVAV